MAKAAASRIHVSCQRKATNTQCEEYGSRRCFSYLSYIKRGGDQPIKHVYMTIVQDLLTVGFCQNQLCVVSYRYFRYLWFFYLLCVIAIAIVCYMFVSSKSNMPAVQQLSIASYTHKLNYFLCTQQVIHIITHYSDTMVQLKC